MCDRALRHEAVSILKDNQILTLYSNTDKNYVQDVVNEHFHGISIDTLYDMYVRFNTHANNIRAYNTAWYGVLNLIEKLDEGDVEANKCYMDRLNEIHEMHIQAFKEQRTIVNDLVKLIRS